VSTSPIVEAALPYTMTGAERLQALEDAVRHVVARGIPGALCECGVWRGGSVLAMALTLRDCGEESRELWLYDTFAGMTEPDERDGPEAARLGGELAVGLEEVRATLLSSGYPHERFHFVAGPVEETLPGRSPGPLALLRLDTDWYASTRHELEHLYPLLAPGGVLIVDDYGHWEGAARAVDEYFAAHPPRPLLARIDYTCRMAVKA
jgi:hypothetical protein